MLSKLQKLSMLHTLRATKPQSIIKTTHRLFQNDNDNDSEFMDKFARQTFQPTLGQQYKNQKGPNSQNFKKKQRLLVQEKEELGQQPDLLSQAYIKEFGKKKGDLLQEWLQMSSDDIIQQCKKYQLVATDKQNENIQVLFTHLNQFESEFLSDSQSVNLVQQPVLDGIVKKFGMKKQEQMDAWLELSNAELMVECQKYSLPVSEKHIHNIQTLFNFLKQFEQGAAKQKPVFKKQETDFEDQSRNASKQFHRKEPKSLTLDSSAQLEMVQSEVDGELSKIFQRKNATLDLNKSQTTKAKPQSGVIGLEEETKRKGPVSQLPLAPSIQNLLAKEFQSKQNSFVEIQIPKQNTQRLMGLEIKSYAELLSEQQQQNNVVDKIFPLSSEELSAYFEQYQGTKQLQEFNQLTNIQKKSTLVNIRTIQQVEEELDPNAKLQAIFVNKHNFFRVADQNYPSLNKKNKQLVASQIDEILLQNSKNQLNELVTSVKNLKSLVYLLSRHQTEHPNAMRVFITENLYNDENIFKIKKSQPWFYQILNLSKATARLDEMDTDGLFRTKVLPVVQEQFFETVNGKQKDLLASELSTSRLNGLTIYETANLLYLAGGEKSLEKILRALAQSTSLNQLPSKQIIYMVEKAIDIENKSVLGAIMGSLKSQIDGRRFKLGETQELVNQLSRVGTSADLELIYKFVQTTSKQLYTVPTPAELSQTIDILQTLHTSQPLSFTRLRMEMKALMISTSHLKSCQMIPLREMIRLATILSPSTFKPTFLFKEIIESKENFATSVSEKEVTDLVDSILNRLRQHRISFDHLQHSVSMMHRQFLSYTGKTFQVFQRVISDHVSTKIYNKILADSFVATRLFTSSDTAETQLIQHMERQLNEINSSKLDWKEYKEMLDMISNSNDIVQCENINKLSAQIIEKAMVKIMADIFSGRITLTFEELLELNSSLLKAITSLSRLDQDNFLQKYDFQLDFSKIIETILRDQLGMQLSQQVNFINEKSAYEIIRRSDSVTWAQIERKMSHLIKHFLVQLNDNKLAEKSQLLELARNVLVKIKNSRSLYSEDLVNLFLLIDKLEEPLKQKGQQGDLDLLMMNVASNLKTIGVKLLYQDTEEQSEKQDAFHSQNSKKLEHERFIKKIILGKYLQIFERNSSLFTKTHQFSLAPLSSLMAELFETFEHQDVLSCMNLQGSNIDNYSEEFILKLYENYAQQAFMAQMYDQNPKFFFEFSKAWPQFLRNNAILNQLTKVKGHSVLVSDQSETLQILTRRNVLHPELMNMHLDTFIRMKDKDQVEKYLKQFLESAAYFGYTTNVNIEQITQVFRRIHKQPQDCNMDELLNYLVVLAISNTYYGDFDEKSRIFIDQALDLVENKFTGTQYVMQKRPRDIQEQDSAQVPASLLSEQEFKLSYFQQIPNFCKTYNKQAIKNSSQEIINETEKAKSIHFQTGAASLFDQDQIDEEGSDIEEQSPDFEGNNTIMAEIETGSPQSSQKSIRKSYERKGTESQYQEDYEYLQYRNKKLTTMGKKDRHLLMYSNINQLNFVDINQKQEAKAWTILFHFRAKSLQSMLFEEFNSISQRNAVGKTKSHELFGKLYLKMMEKSHENGLQIQMANSCDRTGWPIDISLRHRQQVAGKTDQSHAIYFMLQEELCYNAQSQNEEPLGLQKLMIRHLQTISDFKVHFVTENEVQSNLETVVEKLVEKMTV